MQRLRFFPFALCTALAGLTIGMASPAAADLPGLSCTTLDSIGIGVCVSNLDARQSAGIRNLAATPFRSAEPDAQLELAYFPMDQFPRGTSRVVQSIPFTATLREGEALTTPPVAYWAAGVFCARVSWSSKDRTHLLHCVDTDGKTREDR